MRRSGISAPLAAIALLLLGAAPASSQTKVPRFPAATVPPEAERNATLYTLKPDGRDGANWFDRVRHPEVEYEAGETLTFDRYHTVDVMYEWLRRWAERYPEIVELYQVGTSYEGRPIMQVTLTNRGTGPATEKPAAFFEGGRHSGEISGAESVLWMIQHLVESYGTDPEVTRLLDRAAIYLRPKNNPDGSNLYLHTAQSNRSTVRPMDNDGDGLYDEDPPTDLDGDGIVLQMRWRDPNGNWNLDPRDRTGRLMVQVPAGTGSWSRAAEGLDRDGDERVAEDGIGGLDLHRNYPQNWRPMAGQDHTGRGYTQGGSGEYPLSEPETRATVLFTLQNPNIAVVNSMDTSVPMHLRPPSTSHGAESMFPEDLALYEHFDSVGVSITGYPWAGDVYYDYATRNNPNNPPTPLFGHGPDFGYFGLGVIWYGDEIWDGGRGIGDVNGDGDSDELDRLIWQDSVTDGRAFKPWTAFEHPERGRVEIGGWHPKFFSQNGPPEVLEKWARNEGLFNLYLASSLPELVALPTRVTRMETTPDSTTWEIRIPVRNYGRLPTALKQADRVKAVREDRVRLELVELTTEGDDPQARFLDDSGATASLGFLQPGETKEAVFRIRTYGAPALSAKFEVLSTRGGIVRGEVASQ